MSIERHKDIRYAERDFSKFHCAIARLLEIASSMKTARICIPNEICYRQQISIRILITCSPRMARVSTKSILNSTTAGVNSCKTSWL
jgi:hypothetical protein